jgi:uncharacterized protein (TIGR02147 family)
MARPPRVQNYDDFRRFLAHWFQWKKSRGNYSYQQFAMECGLVSASFLLLLIQGRRNVSYEMARKIGEGMKLPKSALPIFLDLCSFNQSTTIQDRANFGLKVAKALDHEPGRPGPYEVFSFYLSWQHVLIRELVSLPDFEENPAWISSRCQGALSEKEASETLQFLLGQGFVIRGPDGKLKAGKISGGLGEELLSAALAKFQRDMILKGARALEELAPAERDISSITVRLSKNSSAAVREKIEALRQEILELEKQDEGAETEVFQINFQAFPLTRREER